MLKQTAKRPGSPPAYAGKSRKNGSYGGGKKDHPRMCGEKVLYSFGLKQVSGITPAYAGKRSPALFPLRSPEDHPRVCGEKKVMRGAKDKRMGSPPHVRGKGLPVLLLPFDGRITPACAGKRLKRSRSTVPPVAIVPLFPSVCNKPVVSDGSPAGRDAPLFLPAENAVPASPAYNLRSL